MCDKYRHDLYTHAIYHFSDTYNVNSKRNVTFPQGCLQ